jgi:hypothetical protein
MQDLCISDIIDLEREEGEEERFMPPVVVCFLQLFVFDIQTRG